jgi:hypothetical protein
VKGTSAAALIEFVHKCAGGNIHLIHRICGSKSHLMKRLLGFLEEFRWVKQGASERLQTLLSSLSSARIVYTREVARKIAAATDLERLAYRCPSFRSFRQANRDS